MGIDENKLKQLEELAKTGNAETEWYELKRQWFNLQEHKKKEDFCKLVAGMANKYGPEKYIIFGIGDKGGFFHAPLEQSGFGDIADISNLLISKVRPPVAIDFDSQIINDEGTNKTISIIIIQPSIDKPHEMDYGSQKNYIPIRKNGKTVRASRTDIELMYWDRKNVIPAYKVDILHVDKRLYFTAHTNKLSIRNHFIVQNLGQHPVAIVSGTLTLLSVDNNPTKIIGDTYDYCIEPPNAPSTTRFGIKGNPLIIPKDGLYSISMNFITGILTQYLDDFHSSFGYKYFITLTSVHGRKFQSEVIEWIR